MNLNYIINQFKKIATMENYVSYKSRAQYYNIKPSQNDVIKDKLLNCKKTIDMEDDTVLINSILQNELSPKGKHINKKFSQLKRPINNQLFSPKKTVNYSLPLYSPKGSKGLLKSASTSACSGNWTNHLNNEVLRKELNEEGYKAKRTLKPCQSCHGKEVSKEEHMDMVNKLRRTMRKEFHFSAETIPKVSIGEFGKYDKYSKSQANILMKNSKERKKFSPQMPIIPIGRNAKEAEKTNYHHNQSTPSLGIFKEINRNIMLNPMKSFVIKKPYVPEMRRTFNATKRGGKKSKEKIIKYLQGITIDKHSLGGYRNTREKLILIIRTDRKTKVNQEQQTTLHEK